MDNLRRGPSQNGEFKKIVILGHECKILMGGLSPNHEIVCADQTKGSNMRRLWKRLRQQAGKIGRKIFVEEQSHAAWDTNVRRSRSAAKAKHANTSSCVRSGNSAKSSVSVVPAAR